MRRHGRGHCGTYLASANGVKPVLRPSDPGESPAKGDERRVHPRIPADKIPGLSASLGPDVGIRLIDISKGGALFEARRRAIPGSEVALRLMTQDGSHLVRGRVVRSRMVRLDSGGMGYQTAISFHEALRDLLPEAASPAAEPEPPQAQADGAGPELPRTASVEDTGAIPRNGIEDTGAIPRNGVEDTGAIPRDGGGGDSNEAWGASPVILFTAQVGGTSDELREMFSHNDW